MDMPSFLLLLMFRWYWPRVWTHCHTAQTEQCPVSWYQDTVPYCTFATLFCLWWDGKKINILYLAFYTWNGTAVLCRPITINNCSILLWNNETEMSRKCSIANLTTFSFENFLSTIKYFTFTMWPFKIVRCHMALSVEVCLTLLVDCSSMSLSLWILNQTTFSEAWVHFFLRVSF